MRLLHWSMAFAIAITGWAAVGSADSHDGQSAERSVDEDHPGFAVYRNYCAVCHGLFADGKGPVAPVLITPPPELSRLSTRYGNPLRADELAEFIDGRKMARSHGTSDMPVWGERLYSSKRDTPQLENVRRGTILRIVEYLESIQVR